MPRSLAILAVASPLVCMLSSDSYLLRTDVDMPCGPCRKKLSHARLSRYTCTHLILEILAPLKSN